MSKPFNKNSMGVALPLIVVFIVVFLAIGLGVGYFAVPTHTTTQITTQSTTQTTIVTTTQSDTSLVSYWEEAANWNWSWGGLYNSQLVPLLNSGNTSIFLLDVRMPNAYATAHIGGAINIPFPNMTAAVSAGTISMNRIIIVVCYTGGSAALTAGVLVGLGYKAYDLWGGMAEWNNVTAVTGHFATVNYPVVTGSAPGTWSVWNPPA
jgi:rhodanese-related sulfurtransferase